MFRKWLLALFLPVLALLPVQGQVAVTTRAAKGSPLSVTEMDTNFLSLQYAANASRQDWGRNDSTSTGLVWGYYGGQVWNGSAWSTVAGATVALTPSATNYVERTEAGTVTVNTSSFTASKYPMAKVICGPAGMTSWTDQRAPISTFTRSESGATTRALTDKVKDVVSVKDFGAKGDGSSDDTTPINNALATGKAVYFPAPTVYYKVTASLILNSNQIIYGDGHTISLIENRTNSAPLLQVVNAGAGRTMRYLIKDLGFYSNTANTTKVLDLRGSSYFKLENVQVIGNWDWATPPHNKIGGVGIDMTTDTTDDENQFGVFSNVYVSYCDYGLRGKMNTLNITGGSFATNTHYGIALITGQQNASPGIGRSFKSLGVTIINTDLSGNHNGSTNSNTAIVLPGASISAVAGTNVYHRAAGNWSTDGFAIGQEVRVYGFATNVQNNGVAVVTNVTSSDLTVDKTLISEGPLTTVTVKTGNYGGGAWIIGDGIRLSGCYHEQNGGRISGLYTPNDVEIDPLSTGVSVTEARWDYDHTKGKVSGDQEDVGEQFGSGPGTNQTGTYNLVPNGNFDNLDATNTPLGWTDSGTGTWSAVPDPSTIPGGHGNGARITLGSGTPRMYHTIMDSAAIARYTGRWVVMTGYIRHNVSGGGALARAGFATSSGGAISSSVDAYVAAEAAPANQWVKYTMRYQIKGTETTLSAVPYLATGTGTVDIAGISVSLGETAWGNAEAPITSGGGDVWSQTFTLGGSKMGWGTAVPTTGTWAVGDRVFNTTATSGNAIAYWSCVGAGTPGSWRAVGAVADNSTNPFGSAFAWDSTSNLVSVGPKTASSTNGGRYQIRDDTGTLRWSAGLLGSAAATAFTFYNNANSRTDATITDSTGLWNFPVTPTTATAAVDDNSTKVGTTAYFMGQKGTATPIIDGTGAAGTSTKWSPIDHVHPTDTSRLAVSASANPSASVGLSAVNGSASTYMRSDGAPALSQAITPTWTGLHTFNQQSIGVTSTDGAALTNTTASTNILNQWSPRLRLSGTGWKTNATAASQTTDWIIENQPQTGAANPTTNLVISSQVNGGGYTMNTTFTSGGGEISPAVAAPGTPAAGLGTWYEDSTSKNFAIKNDAGVVNHGIQTRTATGSNWIRSIADDGTTAISQPAFTDISGTATSGQIPDLGHNPTASVGTSAVNGVATTYMRSDGAPALDVTISPVWTGAHTFSTAITIFGIGSSTNGGRIKFKNDAGTLGWQEGYLGTASATAWNIYDLVNSRAVLALTTGATGTATWTSTRNIFSASVAGQAGVTLTPGVAPTSPNNGDLWQDSTTFATTTRTNGTTAVLLTSNEGRASGTSSAPTGTTSATAVHMAIGGAITPIHTTKVLLIVSGQMANNTINDGASVQLQFGTGSAPTNGAAVTGTQVGATQTHTSLTAADTSGWCISGVVTGLTVGTAIWFDVAIKANTGGTATVTGVSYSAVEL